MALRCDNLVEDVRRIIFEGCNNIRRDGNKLVQSIEIQNEREAAMCWVNTNIMRFEHAG